MSTSSMRTAVLQATAIYLASEILSHHLSTNIFNQVMANEGVRNLTAIVNRTSSVLAAPASATPSQLTLDTGNTANLTTPLRNTTIYNSVPCGLLNTPPEKFYSWSLPREVLIYTLISVLQYYWLLWLETILPARPRRRTAGQSYQGEGDVREEEIVKKWIAQGRVKRASLNWCNTFLKWVLELTIGRLWYHGVEHVVRVLLKLQNPGTVMQGMKRHLAYNLFGTYFSIKPLAALIVFVAVPVHKQIVFLAGADLVGTVFMTTLIRVFAGWAVKTEFAQGFIRNMTEGAEKQLAQGKSLEEPWVRMDEL